MKCGFIPVADTASVELIYALNQEIVENVFHVQKGTPYSLSDLQAVRGIVNTWDAAGGATYRGANSFLNRIRTRALDSVGAAFEDYTLPVARQGLQGGSALPGNATWCLKKATLSSGRSHRGRWYYVGLTSAFFGTTADNISALAAANVLATLNSLIAALAAGGHTMVVVSYVSNKTCRPIGITTPVTQFVAVDNLIDSQRRRLAGRGHP